MFKKIKDKLYFIKKWYLIMFHYPKDTLNVNDHFNYDEYWKQKRGATFIRSLGRWQRMRADVVINTLKNEPSFVLGDIGTGGANMIPYLQEHLKISKVIGYDSSRYALDIAREIGIETVLMDFNKDEELSKIQQADYHLLFEILEHVPAPEKLLSEVYAKSRKGVFFSFPNTGFFPHRFRLFFGRFPMQWRNHPSEHLRFWTAKDLKWWLKALGYENYTVNYYIGVPWLKKIWPNMFAAGFVVFLKK